PTAAAARRMGIEAARAGRWQEARVALEQALKADPNQPEALYAMALCLAQSGASDAAIASLTGALKAGFQDYHALESERGLKPLRGTHAFDALIRTASDRREAFDADLEAGVRESYRGTSFQVRRVSEPRLVLVTDLGERSGEAIVSALAAVEARHRAGLFPNGLRHAIVVHAAKPLVGAEGRVPGPP